MKTLFQNELLTVTREDGGVIRARRASIPIDSAARILEFAELFQLIVPLRERPRLRLLMDMRDAPMNNDPAREEQLQGPLRRIQEGFPKIAVLVRTAVGKLQINRIKRETDGSVVVFDDEAAAIAFLCEEASVGPKARGPG